MAEKRFETFEQALDKAMNVMAERFDKPDQNAVVQLANILYMTQERERFERRGREEHTGEVPYEA